MWSGEEHYSDPTFVHISCSMPIHYFKDSVNNFKWEYRQAGPTDCSEAIVIFPGIRETVSSYFRVMPSLATKSYRVVIISNLQAETLDQFSSGVNQIFLHLGIREVHFIGNDLGGFLALQLMSHPKKRFVAKSVTLINSYISTRQFVRTGLSTMRFLSYLNAKADLLVEFDRYKVLDRMTEATKFVAHEIETLPVAVVAARLRLREQSPIPLDLHIEEESIMIIDTMDRLIQYSPDSSPSEQFKNARLGVMKNGGDWPHLDVPEDLLPYLLAHIRKWGSFVEPELEEALKYN